MSEHGLRVQHALGLSRARRVGSIEEIIPARTIRPYLIETLRAARRG